MINKIIAAFIAISFSCSTMTTFAQEIETIAGGERTVVVGETHHNYILPLPPDLVLTPPTFMQNPPPGARIFPILRSEYAPFNGVLFNGEANAWIEAETTSAPQYVLTYGNAIRAQMTAWTYMELDQLQLSIATEREESRIMVASLERQIASTERLSRRSVLRPTLLTGFIVLILGVVGTTSGFIIGRNH